jgi:hypothetical protein
MILVPDRDAIKEVLRKEQSEAAAAAREAAATGTSERPEASGE